MKTNNRLTIVLLVLFSLFLLSSCAEVQHIDACKTGHVYGFWGGLWHGMIALVSFVGSLFSDDIAVWAVNNNGGWYELGFLIGVGGQGIFGAKEFRKKNN
jgi:hypothetical protein